MEEKEERGKEGKSRGGREKEGKGKVASWLWGEGWTPLIVNW